VITFIAFFTFSKADACTRIFWNNNDQAMLVARTMDLSMNDFPTFYVFPKGIKKNGNAGTNSATWTSMYGSVALAGLGNSNYIVEGVNTAGLSFHYLFLSATQYELRDQRPGVLQGSYSQYLLDNAATVSEALDLMQSQVQLVPESVLGFVWPLHIAMEDAQGDSAVVEFVGGQMVVYHGAEYNVMTNDPTLDQQIPNLLQYQYFQNGGSLPLPGDVDPKSRFVRASAFLLTLSPPSNSSDAIYYLLSAIRSESTPFGAVEFSESQPEPSWPTLWTSLFDLTNKAVYYSHNVARNNFWINMQKLNFSKGAPARYLKAYTPGLAGEVSSLFKPIGK
jgi:choloylglycine hydrolase